VSLTYFVGALPRVLLLFAALVEVCVDVDLIVGLSFDWPRDSLFILARHYQYCLITLNWDVLREVVCVKVGEIEWESFIFKQIIINHDLKFP